MASDPVKEKQELELLERVFLRMGAVETDEQLQQAVDKFLCPVINKLASPFKAVKDKVMELLNHMIRQLKNRPRVLVPISKLLAQVQDPAHIPTIKNFALVYIRLGFSRLLVETQVSLLPSLVQAVEGKVSMQQDILLQLFVCTLHHVKPPSDRDKAISYLSSLLPPPSSPQTRILMLDFLLWYLVLPYRHQDPTRPPPPGLSQSLVTKVTGDQEIDPDVLEKRKICIVKFLVGGACKPDEIVPHLIVAISDPRHSVSDQGDHWMKQISGSVNWNHEPLVRKLCDLYLGSKASTRLRPPSGSSSSSSSPSPGQMQAVQVKVELHSPASLRLKLRMLPYLLKSNTVANDFPICIQIVFESMFGDITNLKLRSLGMDLILHIVLHASGGKLVKMAPLLLTALNKAKAEFKGEVKLLCQAYSGMAELAKKVPELFKKDTTHLRNLFTILQEGIEGDLLLAVQECLSVMATAYWGVLGQSATIIEALMLESTNSGQHHVRLAAAYCARTVFPFNHAASRYVSLLSSADRLEEVREEGRKGMKRPEDKPDSPYPDFQDFVKYVSKRATVRLQSNNCYSVTAGKLPFAPPSFVELLQFLQNCLLVSSGCGLVAWEDFGHNEVKLLKQYVSAIHKEETFQLFFELIDHALKPAASMQLQSVAMETLFHLALASPPSFSQELSSRLTWIKKFSHSTHTAIRDFSGKLLGCIVGHLASHDLVALYREVLQDATDTSFQSQDGSVITLGYITPTCVRMLYKKMDQDKEEGGFMDSSDLQELNELICTTLETLVVCLQSSNHHLARHACSSLGEIVRSSVLPLPSAIEGDGGKALSKLSLVEILRKVLKNTTDAQLKERCVSTLSYFLVGEPAFPHVEAILKVLFVLKEEKQIDLQFSVGEALACISAGPLCSLAQDPWQSGESLDQKGQVDDAVMEKILTVVIGDYSTSTAPLVRQAACVWLLCIVKHSQKHPAIQGHMQRIQITFTNFLADSNDMVQEIASRGLGLVYSLCDSTQREGLVQLLVETVMEGKRPAQSVGGDTKVFREGSMGKVLKGSRLTTYKELCSLASDLNQPDLVYHFMHLSNHNAIWDSKKGAAFGVSSIVSQAQEQLAPYLPTLVPRLYRYKYDPVPRIQQAMSSIWNSIVPESKKATDKYYHEIMKDLISNLNHNQWRNREASCVALKDLLVGRQAKEVVDYLARLWELCLRVKDDIKETVRKAADIACGALSKVTISACDANTMSDTGAHVIEQVLPVLLNQGMTSPASEVRSISLLTVLKLAKSAGALLKPHIHVLIPMLLEAMSSVEPQMLNYLSLQLGAESSQAEEVLEVLRVSASKSSPMMEVAKLCIPHIDPGVLSDLSPRLVDLLKTGVGLATKVAVAEFLISLVHHSLSDLKPYAGKLLAALLTGLDDRSATIKKAYARAIGHIVKVAKDNNVVKLIDKLKKLYLENDESSVAVAHTVHAMSVFSTDVTKNLATQLVPLVFLAMHTSPKADDPSSEGIVKLWRDTWQEIVPSTGTAVKLYLKDLVEGVCPLVAAQSWAIKRQAAAALATLAENAGSEMQPPLLCTILTSLLEGLHGRVWDGKKALLLSFRTLCQSYPTLITRPQESGQPAVSEITKALLQQCKKTDILYKAVAIQVTGATASALKVDIFSPLFEIISAIVSPIDSVREEVNERERLERNEEERERRAALLDLEVKAYEAIGSAWPADEESQGAFHNEVLGLLNRSLPKNNWKVQIAILDTLSSIFGRLKVELSNEVLQLHSNTLSSLSQCIGNVRYSAVRKKSVSVVEILTDYLQAHEKLSALPSAEVAELRGALQALRDEQLKDQALKIIRKLP